MQMSMPGHILIFGINIAVPKIKICCESDSYEVFICGNYKDYYHLLSFH